MSRRQSPRPAVRRVGPPVDDEAGLALGHWAGVVPVRLVAGPALPGCDLPAPDGLAPTFGAPAFG